MLCLVNDAGIWILFSTAQAFSMTLKSRILTRFILDFWERAYYFPFWESGNSCITQSKFYQNKIGHPHSVGVRGRQWRVCMCLCMCVCVLQACSTRKIVLC